MRIAIMGTGDLGSRYGGALALAGEDVTFIARSQLERIRSEGLTLTVQALGRILLPNARGKLEGEIINFPVKVTRKPSEVEPVDLLFFSVKTYDLEEAAVQAKPLVGADTVVLPVQNGIGISEKLFNYFGEGSVIGGIQYPDRIMFGELDGSRTPRIDEIVEVFLNAGINAQVRDNILVDLWEKFITICATGGAMAVVRLPLGAALACPETKALFRGVMNEAYAIAKGKGVPVSENIVDSVIEYLESLPPSIKGSQLQDVEAGRRLELDDLNGAAVRLGRELDIPTPLNFAVYAALKPFVHGFPKST